MRWLSAAAGLDPRERDPGRRVDPQYSGSGLCAGPAPGSSSGAEKKQLVNEHPTPQKVQIRCF